MWKRDCTLLLCLVMVLVLLTACAGAVSNEASSESQTTSEPAATVAPDATTQASEDFNIDNINTRNLIFWDRMGTQHIMGRTNQAFADALNELSEGKITSTMYLSGEIEVARGEFRVRQAQ